MDSLYGFPVLIQYSFYSLYFLIMTKGGVMV
jgi:hypothetical protein